MIDNESIWIEKAIQGDENAFALLVDRYQKPVFALCYRMLGNSNDAEDAAQESFIRAYMHLKKFDLNRSFITWLLSIASHHCIDRLRKRQLTTISMDALPDEIIPDSKIPNPEAISQRTEREIRIQNMLMELKPIDRAVIVLRYWHNYSEEEIAHALELTVSAVKSRLYRSRQSLAQLWLSLEHDAKLTERRPYESPAL